MPPKQPIHSRSCLSRQGCCCSAELAGLSPRGHCLSHPVSPGCNRSERLLHLPLQQKLSSGPASQCQGHTWCLKASTPRLGWSSQLPAGHAALGPFPPSPWGTGEQWAHGCSHRYHVSSQEITPAKALGRDGQEGGGITMAWAQSPSIPGWCQQPHSFHPFSCSPARGRRLRSGSAANHGQESRRQCCRLHRSS